MEMVQRRLLISNKKPQGIVIPKGYKRVSHIESVDGAYIDLNLPFQKEYSFKGSFKTVETTPDAFYVFGANGNANYQKYYLASSGTIWGSHSAVTGTYGSLYKGVHYIKRGAWHAFEHGNGFTIIDGISLTGATSKIYPIPHSPILFGCNNNGTIETYPQCGGDFQALEDGDTPTIVRDLVCMVRLSDGEVGYYDISCLSICPLTGTPFYTNAGSGHFIAGDDV